MILADARSYLLLLNFDLSSIQEYVKILEMIEVLVYVVSSIFDAVDAFDKLVNCV